MKRYLAHTLLLTLVASLGPNTGPRAARRRDRGGPIIRRVFDAKKKAPPPRALVTILNENLVTARQYRNLRDASCTLLEKYSPDKHYFIGVGRDATPIIAFLQNLGEKRLAINFPGSKLATGKDTPEIMAQYCNKLIPREALRSGRKIVFVDCTSSGRGLDYWAPNIKPHLRRASVCQVAFAEPSTERRRMPIWANWQNRRPKAIKSEIIATDKFPDVAKYPWKPYENVVCEYPRHSPGHHAISVLDNPRPEYQKFRDAVMRRMETDRKLDKFLRQLPGQVFANAKETAAGKAPAKRARAIRKKPLAKKKAPAKKSLPAKKKAPATSNAPALSIRHKGQAFEYLSQQQYTGLKSATQQMMQRYPPAKYRYVFVGRSAAPLFGLMQALKPGSARYLPVDGLRKPFKKQDKKPGTKPGTSILAARAKRFLRSTRKPLLLIQRTDSGELLTRVGAELRQILGPRVSVTTLALYAKSAPAKRRGQRVMKIAAWPEVVALRSKGSGAGHVAPVVRKGHAGPKERFTTNPRFKRFVDALKKARLAQDPQRALLKRLVR
jgi:hypothetical protein